jgi:crotonobetainyl-CoA:carnitine CoA-transferase CaiB-like acyl-CoA transferase
MVETPGMLAGPRVLDLTTSGALLCGRLLVDLGANVIAVEPPHGNPTCSRCPFWQDREGPDTSLYWLAYSHGNRSITYAALATLRIARMRSSTGGCE